MKILIAYASKYGSARSCVERLANALKGLDVTIVDLSAQTVDISSFDIVVAGSAVYMGRLLPAARKFFKQNKTALAQKSLYLFLCCGISHEYEYYREAVFPKELRDAAVQSLYFGGRLTTDGLSLKDKLIVRSIRSSIMESEIEDGEYTPSLPGILPENIDRMATYIRRALAEKQ